MHHINIFTNDATRLADGVEYQTEADAREGFYLAKREYPEARLIEWIGEDARTVARPACHAMLPEDERPEEKVTPATADEAPGHGFNIGGVTPDGMCWDGHDSTLPEGETRYFEHDSNAMTPTQRLANLVRAAADRAAVTATSNRLAGLPDDAAFETGRQAAFTTVLGWLRDIEPAGRFIAKPGEMKKEDA
jgi:hypothetical protein